MFTDHEILFIQRLTKANPTTGIASRVISRIAEKAEEHVRGLPKSVVEEIARVESEDGADLLSLVLKGKPAKAPRKPRPKRPTKG